MLRRDDKSAAAEEASVKVVTVAIGICFLLFDSEVKKKKRLKRKLLSPEQNRKRKGTSGDILSRGKSEKCADQKEFGY